VYPKTNNQENGDLLQPSKKDCKTVKAETSQAWLVTCRMQSVLSAQGLLVGQQANV
jgi:hypothetical protein